MRSYILASLCLLCLSYNTKAQSTYDASAISKDLMPYASAVIRKMEVSNEVKDLNNTIYHLKEAVTILNKNGDGEASIEIWHNKDYQIKYVKGIVFDQFGKAVAKFSERDFKDYSAADESALFEDSRIKQFRPGALDYPYTVEYEYEIRSKQSLNFFDWRPNPSAGTAVESSRYQFICKPEFKIRYKEFNYPGKVAESTNAGQTTYTWEVKNLKAIKPEPYSPQPQDFLTIVSIAPESFAYQGYSGKFTDWKSLGQWNYDVLLKNRSQLPPETVEHIKSLTANISDPKLKAKAIYEYMQHKTRYVSVQVGIGGYQPFLASDVDKLGYGDCKALVNYTQALLKAANIDSYYCVVKSGSMKHSLINDFASMAQGDHIILCLPFKNDTTWLECTSKHMPFGFLSSFTDDRWVLACTPEGGKLMHTPKYTAAQNKQVRTASLSLKDDGMLSGTIKTIFEGTQFDEDRPTGINDYDDNVKKIKEDYPINNMMVEKLELTQNKGQQPVGTETIIFNARDYASTDGGRFIFMANLANRVSRPPREVRNRTTNVYINRGYTDIDEITYTVPAGYRMDSHPLNVSLNKPFGRFTATSVLKGNQLIFRREIQMIDGTYPKDSYQDLVNFYQAIADADSYMVALVKAS